MSSHCLGSPAKLDPGGGCSPWRWNCAGPAHPLVSAVRGSLPKCLGLRGTNIPGIFPSVSSLGLDSFPCCADKLCWLCLWGFLAGQGSQGLNPASSALVPVFWCSKRCCRFIFQSFRLPGNQWMLCPCGELGKSGVKSQLPTNSHISSIPSPLSHHREKCEIFQGNGVRSDTGVSEADESCFLLD